MDYAAPKGTPVHAIGSGTLIDARYASGTSQMIKIRYNSTYTAAHLHLSGYGKGIRNDSKVQQSQVIEYVGNFGLSTGPHLDFQFYKNDTPVDLLKVEAPPSLFVKKDKLAECTKLRLEMGLMLYSLNMPVKASLMTL